MLEFRAATSQDLDFLLSLRSQTMRAHFLASGIELTDADEYSRVLDNFDSAEIVLLSGKPIGLVKLVHKNRPWLLQQVQLLPEYQNQGLGTKIISALLAQASEVGEAIELHVLKVNPAKRLYERLGFSVVGESQNSFTMRTEA